jgi:hypothetical protein
MIFFFIFFYQLDICDYKSLFISFDISIVLIISINMSHKWRYDFSYYYSFLIAKMR